MSTVKSHVATGMIVTAPDPILETAVSPVEDFEQAKQIAFRMRAALRMYPLVGLAANQIGEDASMCYILLNSQEWLLMINPIIDIEHGPTEWDYEGCGSLPGVKVNVPRYRSVEVKYYDENGERHDLTLTGFEARVAQHEIDHLEGVLITEYGPVESMR